MEIVSYCGKPIDEMSREELVEAIKLLGRMLDRYQEDALARHAEARAVLEHGRNISSDPELENQEKFLRCSAPGTLKIKMI